ncbi:hypothetical protein AB2F46_25335 (plasmid) [Escherichia coli]
MRDAVEVAGKAGDVLHDYPRKLPLSCVRLYDGIGEGDIYFRLTFEILRPVLHPAELLLVFHSFLMITDLSQGHPCFLEPFSVLPRPHVMERHPLSSAAMFNSWFFVHPAKRSPDFGG